MVVDPGAAFGGEVDGGNLIGASIASTLELAPGTSAGVVGTLSGLGTGFVNFAAITIDGGAIWDLVGANTVAAGVTVTNLYQLNVLGSLGNAGSIAGFVGVAGSGTLTNAASGVISGFNAVGLYDPSNSIGNAGNITGTNFGVVLAVGATVGNSGTISGGDVGIAVAGMDPPVDSVVTNVAGGLISGSEDGIEVSSGGASIDNAGTITGGSATFDVGIDLAVAPGTVVNAGSISAAGTAVAMSDGGTVTNDAGGTITAGDLGLSFGNAVSGSAGAVGTVVNAGAIIDTGTMGSAVALYAGGSVTNAAGAVIQGSTDNGIFITDGAGTVSNAGTIAVTGTNIDAVLLGAGSPNRVIVDPGAVFSGTVDGGNTIGASIVSTLELAAGSGTLAGVGASFVNFGGITFDPGAAWDIGGSTAALAGGEVISGFTVHDTIDLVGVSEVISGFNNGTLSLTGTAPLDLLLPGSFTVGQFEKAPSSDGTAITLACFVDGTRILTEAGEVEVERLEPGVRVVSVLHRKLLPIAWIGHRRLREASPVRVVVNAFGPGEPHRDLWLSPDHALLVDQVLIPVRYLVNGVTIVQEHRDEAFYYHIELSTHGVLLAEGLPAESYLDTGNRAAFANGGAAVQMRPDFALWVWEAAACAPLVVDGPAIVAARERLHARAVGRTTIDATDAMNTLTTSDGENVHAAEGNPLG
jgi:hypothetical protein